MKQTGNTTNLITAIILSLSTMLLSASASAEPSPDQRPPKFNHEQIVKQLYLDETTQQALLQLMNKHRAQREGQGYENHKNDRAMREQHRAEVKALLGEEKFAAFEKAMWTQRQQHRPEPKNRDE